MKYTLTNDSVTVIHEGSPFVVRKGAPNFAALRDAVLREDWATVQNNLTVKKSLSDWAKGKFTVRGETFYYGDTPLPSEFNSRILAMVSKNEDPDCVFKFWERLQKNPSWRSVHQLFSFLQHMGIPLTPDGCFLAYKSVNSDFSDVHSGKFENKPGNILEMPRNKISDDPNHACHEGFHVGALSYAQTFHRGGKIVVCKVDPADVVCVPHDESQRKMRVCKYEVVGMHGEQLPSTVFVGDDDKDVGIDDETYDIEDDGLEESNAEIRETGGSRSDDDEAPEVIEPVKGSKVTRTRRKAKRGYAKFDKMNEAELMDCSLEDLRQYAGKGLEIVGASKILGGKTGLIGAILSTRAAPGNDKKKD